MLILTADCENGVTVLGLRSSRIIMLWREIEEKLVRKFIGQYWVICKNKRTLVAEIGKMPFCIKWSICEHILIYKNV